MDGIPVANVDTSGTASTLAYVTADQLGTPRAVADGSGNTEWQNAYQGNPWNEQAPTSNGYTYNLGFPGQYFDQETGLNYNVNRDYDSSTGRYIESDPTGLDGGINTYAYAEGQPNALVDPLGKQVTQTTALGAEIGTAIEPGGGTAVGAGLGAVVGGGILVYEICHKDKQQCPPCTPPVGTIGYRLDKVPPSKPHYPFPGD